MRTRSVAAALLLAFAPATFAAPGKAQAQTTDDPTVKAARARFNEGVEFFDRGQFENARASFLQAYALRKHPAVLENLAQSCLRSGHTLEAAKYFQQYLHESSSLTATQRTDAEKGLAEARTKLGRLEVSAASGAEIFVDGDHVGTAPLSDAVDVEPGTHTLKANSDSKSVSVTAGQVLPVKFAPGGTVTVAPVPVPEETPTPPPDTTQNPPPPPPKDSGPGLFSRPKTMVPFWLGISVGVAGVGTAILFAVFKGQANSSYQDLSNEISMKGGTGGTCVNPAPGSRFYQACQSFQSDANQVDSDATVANIAVGVGIAGVAFALGWYLFAAKQDAKDSAPPPSSSFVPLLGPHTNGLGYVGSF